MMACGLSAADAFRHTCSVDRGPVDSWFAKAGEALVGCSSSDGNHIGFLDQETWGDPRRWYFIGDIHGDFFALHALIDALRTEEPDFRLIFLGDIVDRGPHGLECLQYLLDLAIACPGQVAWIAGNHDIGVCWSVDQCRFASSVAPAEFADFLNICDGLSSHRALIGQAFIRLAESLPRALVTPDGLLVTHGGFPHSDLQEKVTALAGKDEKLAWLNEPACLQDFTWTRISRYPKKFPNRESTGCSYGFQDFAGFAVAVADVAQLKRLVTGHDHPEAGFCRQESWQEHPALTLTGYGFGNTYQDIAAWRGEYREQLYLGRGMPDALPEVIPVAVDRNGLEEFVSRHLAAHFPMMTEAADD